MPSILETTDCLARTIWGEARSCGAAGMRHVACVVLNRASHPTWWGVSIESVCLQPYQFSCRNADDPNQAKLQAVTTKDPEFMVAMQIASAAVHGKLIDETGGADSYYAVSMQTPPAWATGAHRTFTDGWHNFYVTRPNAAPGVRPNQPNVSVHAVTADDLNDAELNTLGDAQ